MRCRCMRQVALRRRGLVCFHGSVAEAAEAGQGDGPGRRALEASRVCTLDAPSRHCWRERAEQVALVALDLLGRDAREALPERMALLVRRDVGEAHRAPRGSRQAAAFSGKGVQP